MRIKYKFKPGQDDDLVLALMYDIKKQEIRCGGPWLFIGQMERILQHYFNMIEYQNKPIGRGAFLRPQKGWVTGKIDHEAWVKGLKCLKLDCILTKTRGFRRLIR